MIPPAPKPHPLAGKIPATSAPTSLPAERKPSAAEVKARLLAWADQHDIEASTTRVKIGKALAGSAAALIGGLIVSRFFKSAPSPLKSLLKSGKRKAADHEEEPHAKHSLLATLAINALKWALPFAIKIIRAQIERRRHKHPAPAPR